MTDATPNEKAGNRIGRYKILQEIGEGGCGAGATETGRPYFVMELVRGVPITDYCDEAKLSTPA